MAVSIASGAGSPLVNSATASGGGSVSATATDSTVIVAPGSLGLSKTHTGNFLAGGTGSYTVIVTNGGSGPTTGVVTVTDTAPAGMTVTAMSGTGWSCSSLPTCTRGDALAAGASFPRSRSRCRSQRTRAEPLVNSATASGGGSPGATATDSTVVVQPAALAMAKTHAGTFVPGGTGTYTLSVSNGGGGPTSGTVTVVDTAPPGMTVTAMSGAGWTCATLPTCTRADALNAGASYPAITVGVSIAANAVSPLVNSATASGGGSASATATDSTVLGAAADMRVALAGLPPVTQPNVVVVGRLTCTNNGAVAATGATCAVTSGAIASGCRSGAVAVTLPIPSLAPGASIACDIRATAPASGSLTINATTGASNDSGTTGKSASHAVAVTPAPGTGSISGVVWYDLNRNGLLDGNEPRRPGWFVQLLSGATLLASTVSDNDGAYVFAGLQPGRYSVRFVDPGTWTLTRGMLPVDGIQAGNGSASLSQLVDINVIVGGSVVNQSLPIDPSGVVYDSLTRLPLAGASVTLLLDGALADPAWVAGASATQVTGAGGQYAFFLLPGAPAGTYSLVAVAPGYRGSPPSASIAPAPAPATPAAPWVSRARRPWGRTRPLPEFPRPVTDITNNNIPLDSAGTAAAPAPVPTLWSGARSCWCCSCWPVDSAKERCGDAAGSCARIPRMTSVLLGCIADDFTGATDLANMLVAAACARCRPSACRRGPLPEDVDAVVVALKSRTIAGGEAVAQSLAALRMAAGATVARQIYFKYCSTFDSTPQGQHRSGGRGADGCARRATSPSPARRSRTTAAPSTGATCSWATCCCPSRACAIIR